MGYLNNTSITVDAVLTSKGRELLARGTNAFNITQFAISDDEIDYSLWNPDHPLGSAYYGVVIENLPMVEALPDESQMVKYKLITLPAGAITIPVLAVTPASLALASNQASIITPSTPNFQNGNGTYGYTAILSDSSIGTLVTVTKAASDVSTEPQFIGDVEKTTTVTAVGLTFRFTAKQLTADKTANIIIIGNETGGRVTIPVSVTKYIGGTTVITGNNTLNTGTGTGTNTATLGGPSNFA
jgi:hypothetical protein